ncbi:MAG: RNA-directed DNA polymerase [Actinomycetota bacterium]
MYQPSSRPPRVRSEIRAKRGGVRVLSHLDAALAAAYASAVVRVVPAVEGRLRREVVADRVRSASEVPPTVVLADWRAAASRFRSAASAFRGPVLRTDVAECYASISADVVADALEQLRVPRDAIRRCARTMRELADEGVEGLPIGPPASAVLANAVLLAGDDVLARSAAPFLRWVDDWCIRVASEDHACEVLGRLGGALSGVRLRLNDAKTVVTDGRDAGGWPGSSEYHRAAHAHPLSLVARTDAVVPRDRRVGARGRAARGARGQW